MLINSNVDLILDGSCKENCENSRLIIYSYRVSALSDIGLWVPMVVPPNFILGIFFPIKFVSCKLESNNFIKEMELLNC